MLQDMFRTKYVALNRSNRLNITYMVALQMCRATCFVVVYSETIGNGQKLLQSDPIFSSQNQNGKNG